MYFNPKKRSLFIALTLSVKYKFIDGQDHSRTNTQLSILVSAFAAFYFELANVAIITQVKNYLRSD